MILHIFVISPSFFSQAEESQLVFFVKESLSSSLTHSSHRYLIKCLMSPVGLNPKSPIRVTWHQASLLGKVKLSPFFSFYTHRRRERRQEVTAATSCRLLLGHLLEQWTFVSVPALLNSPLCYTIIQGSGTFHSDEWESSLTAEWVTTRSKVIAPNLLWWKWLPL